MDCTWVTARTQCSESDGALYDAHIRAVKLQAKTAGKAEVDLFHNLCWGYGKVALGRYPYPPEPLTARILDVKSVFCVFGFGLKTQCILCICSQISCWFSKISLSLKARIHTRWGPLDPTSAAAGEGKFAVFREFSLIFRSFDQHLTLGVGHVKTGN